MVKKEYLADFHKLYALMPDDYHRIALLSVGTGLMGPDYRQEPEIRALEISVETTPDFREIRDMMRNGTDRRKFFEALQFVIDKAEELGLIERLKRGVSEFVLRKCLH